MAWLIVAVVVLFLAIAFPWFRIVLGIVVFGVAIAIWYSISSSQRETAAAKTRIRPDQVELFEMRLGNTQLTGRVRNLSPEFTLTGVELKLQLEDCVDKKCEVVGETAESLYLNVPPGQS